MIDRGNGARAFKAVSARAGREALLRKALLGSTALIGITLATPALAQSTSPAGGGTISGSGTYTDGTATNGGVQVDNTQNTGITMSGVTINNTSGNPNGSGYKQTSANGQSVILYTEGANSLRTDQNGAALFMQAAGANLTWAIGQTDNDSTTDLTGTYGAYLVADGYIDVVDYGTTGSLRNVTGINGDTGIYANSIGSNVNLQLRAPVIAGFTTGIHAGARNDISVTTTGGSIATLTNGRGINAVSSGGTIQVVSGSAITTSGTGIGIKTATTNGNTYVTTTAGGTINGGQYGIQVNAAATGQTTTVTVGAAIGDSTRPSNGVSFLGTGVVGGDNLAYINANVSSGSGSYAVGSANTNTDLYVSVASGTTVTSQGSTAIMAGRNVTVINHGTISATSASGSAVYNAQGPSTLWVSNTGTMTAGGTVINAAAAVDVGNLGTITATNFAGVVSNRGGIVTNSGTITGGSSATSGWAILFNSSAASTGQTVGNAGTITGGGAGAIKIDASAASTLNFNSGSTTTGLIKILGSGTTTTTLGGALNGNYDASTATGVQNFTLASTGSMQGATFGSGNDIFTWSGGAFSGTIDGGAGTDLFAIDLGSSTNRTLDQSSFFATNVTNFESYGLLSGNLTLTGSRNGGLGWTVAGGNATTFTLNGSLTNITGTAVTLTTADLMFVQSGAQLSATGDVIYSSASGNNVQNSGTITSGTGLSSAIAFGSGTVDNFGTITYAAGGSITTQGNGVLASANQLSLSNHTGATLIGRWDGARANNGAYVVNDGLIRGDRFAGVEITGTSVVINNATGRIYGASGEGSGLLINSGAVQVTNAGQIVGAGPAGINNIGSGLLSLSNSGTIATGTLDGSNNYVQGGNSSGIVTGSANVTNSGLIEGQSGGIVATGALTLVNTGTIAGRGAGTSSYDGVHVGGASNILNAGTISQATYAGIYSSGGGTITNAAAGVLTGGNVGTGGVGVALNAGGTFNNYGLANSLGGNGVLISNGGTANLFAGSITGNITGGAGNDTLAIYTGQTNASAVTQGYTDAVTGAAGTVTLQNSGTLAAASYGAIDLGGGNDTLQLRGTGSGAQQGEFSLATSTGAETITKLDSGTWRLSGAAAVPGITINSNGGTLQFQGTSGIGTINANGGIVRANGAGAFNGAVVHLLSSNVQFGASGVYANNFVLDVPSVLNGQPAVFENLFGGNAILSGSITSGSGTNAAGQAIGASQAVTFTGIGGSLFNLTGTGNSWTGITTIDSGVTVRGSTSAISGGNIVDNGTLTYIQSGASTSGTVISGTGALRVEGGQIILTGFNTYTGGTTVAGGSLQVGNGSASGRITGAITVDSGGTLIFNRNDNYDFTSAISGAGNVQALGTVSLSGAITNTGTFTVDSATGGQVTLTGSRSGANSSGVTLAGSGNILRVGLSGSVAGGQYVGVRLGGVNDGVDNFGSITNTGTGGDNGYGAAIAVVATAGTSTINNGSASNSSATISGQNAGINHVGSGGIVATGALSVNNYGLIAGNLYNAIENQGGSGNLSVGNKATGRIVGQGNAGGGNGIGMGGTGTLSLDNAGLIVGRSNGIATGSTATITNSGTIATGTLSFGTSGTLSAGGGNGIQIAGGTITNQAGGVIQGSFLNGSGADTNAITSIAATTVNNSGQILGVAIGSTSTARTNGVYISGGIGTVTNYATGLITGGWNGVYLLSGGAVTNTGTIAGNLFYGVQGASTLTNNAGGRILGISGGASMAAGGTLNNSGLVAAATYDSSGNTYTASTGTGVTLTSGTVINQYNGTITGATGVSATGTLVFNNSGGTIVASTNAGLNVAGTDNQLYNSGTLTGGSNATQGYGVRFTSTSTGTLNNQSGGLISGGTGGVLVGAAAGVSIDNGGAMVGLNSGSRGIYFSTGSAMVTNQMAGVIVGQGWGIQVAGTGNINNTGFIGSGTLSGDTTGTFTVNASGSGVIFNGGYLNNTGTIIGGTYGVGSGGTTAANIGNVGTITGGTYAIYLTGTNNDTVSLFSGSTTNGAIALGAGDDTVYWYGGTFTNIDGEGGNDRFAASISAPTTLDLSTITGFEQHSLNGGETLTLTGTQTPTDGGWTVTGSTLAVGGTAKLEMTGSGVTLSDAGANLTVNAGGQLIAHDAYAVAAYAGGSVTNAGLIKSTGNGFDGVITNGGTVDNQAGGRIIAAGNGVTLQASGTTLTNAGVIAGQANGVMGSDDYQTLTNTGVIVAGTAGDNATAYWQTNANLSTGDGVRFTAGGSVTNVGGYVNGNTTGIIVGGANGVTISGGAATIENSGTLQGNSGYGISIDTAGGQTSTITNHQGGALVGGTGAALLSGDGTVNMTNEVGSYMYGSIVSTGNGTRNIDLSGVVYGDYDASSGAGVDNVVLRSGSIYGANLGDGDDSFTYIGGTISGMIDGGAGNDWLYADFGNMGGSTSVSLANFTGFENIGLVAGDMTLTGPSANPGQSISAGVGGHPAGTITFDDTSDLTGDIYVNGGTIRAVTAGAFGSGTIHMIDPTAIFGASGNYGNNISLEVAAPSSANPATLKAETGVVATLTGAITTSGLAGVDPDQDLVIAGPGTIVLTNTANSWTGTTTVNSGATLQGASDTISGSAILNNGTLAYQQAYSGTVGQDITGSGNVKVGGLSAGNTLTFAGTNSFNGSILVQDASSVAISGSTRSNGAAGVNLGNAASRLEVTATGSLAGNSGVTGNGANQVVTNLGSITGISGAAISLGGANAQVDNSGTIQALNAYAAVYLAGAAGTVTNNAGGSITSQGTGVFLDGNDSSLVNAGNVNSSDANAVYLGGTGTVTNSGTIIGGTNGVGIWATQATTITNQSGGTISGGVAAIRLDGIDEITLNLEAGSTTGQVASTSTGNRIVNILGTLNGGYLGGAGVDTITLDTGATLTGTLDGGAGLDTLALTGTGSATLGSVANIESATKSGSGTWTLGTANSVTGWTINGGTLVTAGAMAANASVNVANGTLQLNGNQGIGVLSGTGTVALGANTLGLSGTGTNFGGVITGTGNLLVSGTATLSGANAYTGQTVVSGTLTLGASNVLADASTLIVQTGGTVDLGANNDTVAIAAIGGTLTGSGTLTAAQYQLTDATVNANLGTGTVYSAGTTALNGTAAGNVEVTGGTLSLGADSRLADTATVQIDSGATLNLGTHSDTIATALIGGTLAGTGTLTASNYTLANAVVNANLGTGTVVSSGITALNGTAAGNVRIMDGTLSLGADNRLADTATVQVDANATLNLGAFNDTIGNAAISGTLAGSGTLTAAQYDLYAATVNANLGTGALVQRSGVSTLNGTAASDVAILDGTLKLGAANRLADAATVAIGATGALDIQGYNDTIGLLQLSGTLAGTGTLTASQYQLTGGTVNANLGAGTLFNVSGNSTLNGAAAGDVVIQAGTLTLGASDRLADTATVAVNSDATLNIGAFNDKVGILALKGTLAGTGTLTAGQYQLTGATVNANLGAGTLFNVSGNSTLNGTAAGDVAVQAGTLALGADNRLADTATVAVDSNATLNIGAFNDTVGVLALNGTLAGTGTMTAGQYQLTGATVNANLGTGTLFNLSDTSTLNGTVAATNVSLQGGTLKLGSANRLADTATVVTAAGTTFDLATYNETIGALALGGTLAGTGTLTASQYQLNGATVNANLGAGTVYNMGGTSTLTGTAAANTVTVQGGTLRLGASDRLSDTATVGVASGATFDLATYNETVASITGTGTIALGTGRLTLNNAGNTAFGGSITGSGTIDKQGIGTLTLAGTFATTGRIDVSAGTLAFSGSTQGGIRVQGGSLIGGGTLAGALTINSGSFSPGGLAIGGLGAINPIGAFTVNSLVATGGNLLFDFGGTSFNFASDSIKVNGAATLSGGTVAVNALTAAASDYRFNQLYTIVQATSLTGTFANGSVFATVASNPNLKWRLRYDLVANAVVLQVQKNMEFNDGVAAGDANTLAVANALSNSTTGNASDTWSATLNTITALDTARRVAAFKSFSGEALTDISTATISANNLFTDLLRQRVGDGSDALVGGGFAGASLADVRTTTTAGNTFASSLAGASLPGTGAGDDTSRGGIWGQVYGGYQKLLGDGVHAGVENTTAGVAMGVETKLDGFTLGVAGGIAQIDSDVNSRNSTVSGNQYQLGGYASYDAGSLFLAASGSWYSGDFDSRRTLSLGTSTSLATGDISSKGYAFGLTGGFRTELGNGLRLALIGSASKVHDKRDGFTETAMGGLGLQVASASRDLFTASGELRLGAQVKTGAGVAMPWVSAGVRYNSGDLDTLGAMRFSGAPAGTGSFGVSGARIAPVLGTLGVGIDARASQNVRLGIALEGSAGENTREGRASVRVKIGF